MSNYFSNFPIVSYNGKNSRDITRRTNFVNENLSNPFVFLPYTVKEGEKPEDIAYYYYGSVDFTWVVLMANEIKDPYNEWYVDEEKFHQLLIKKYAELSGFTDYRVVDWCRSHTNIYNVLYYEKDGLIRSPESFETTYEYDVEGNIVLLSNGMKKILNRIEEFGWTPVRIYDYEYILNENKKEILLVDKSYIYQIEKEFKKKIKV